MGVGEHGETTTSRHEQQHGNGGHGHGHGDHGHGHGDHAAMSRSRFWWRLLLALPVVYTSHMVSGWFGYHVPDPLTWIPPVLGTAFFLSGGSQVLTALPPAARAP